MDPFIAKHLRGVSRTYAILVPMLPNRLADAVGLAYLVLRIVDTLEDSTELSDQQRHDLFALLDAGLRGEVDAVAGLAQPIGDTPDEQALMQATPEVFARLHALEPEYCDAICQCAQAMADGVRTLFARSIERDRPYPAVRDTAELREYCYYVAGVVGEMLCAMMAHYLKLPALLRLRELAVELGIGLQLVNILKDALQDSRHGRRYLPAVDDGNVTAAEVYRAALAMARESLARGVDFVTALPQNARGLRSFCGLPIAWGAMTLARAERDARQAKITREHVTSSIQQFEELAEDDHGLRQWLKGLLGGATPATA